jgi:hypothetical protein
MIHQYDAYWAVPSYWVEEPQAQEELTRKEVGRMKKALAEHAGEHGGAPNLGVDDGLDTCQE